MRVCFVCSGNICRSPTAEAVLRQLAAEAGADVTVSSAGTGGWHAGEDADRRSLATLRAAGYVLDGHRAQQWEHWMFADHDLVVALDQSHAHALRELAPSHEDAAKVRLLREWDDQAGGDLDVPDPYYGGARGFEDVLAMVERSCRALLDDVT